MSRHQPMSMEAMLDEERREVLALLEGKPAPRYSSTSPVSERRASSRGPQSPVRSMLDIGDDNASVSSGNSKRAPAVPVRSMLDIDPPPADQAITSGPNSPVESKASVAAGAGNDQSHLRSMSDTSSRPNFGPHSGGRLDPTADYQFSGITTNNMGQAKPKRNTQGGRISAGQGAMAEVARGGDLSSIILPGERGGRHGSMSGPTGGTRSLSARRTGSKSRSPHGRVGWRSPSPNVSGRFHPIPGTAVLDDGTVIDINNAYRKLSDANLAYSTGGLSELATRKRAGNDDEPGSGRLAKDWLTQEGEEEYVDSSDDDGGNDSSDDEDSRGRKMSPHQREDKGKGVKRTKEERKTLSLLAAAEQERLEVSSQQPQPGYRSLFDEPQITVTGPGGEKPKSKSGVHPTTAFDNGPSSGPASAIGSDEEQDVSDIRRAQKLAFSMTPTISTPDSCRAIRIIYRGEYQQIQQTAEDENRRLRKYLVATDLSDESSHALEWAIGTALRDGDTLIAIYCVDEEQGIYSSDDVLIPDESKAHKEQAAAINAVTSAKEPPATPTPMFPHLARASALGFGSRSSSPAPGSRDRDRDRAEEERRRAVEDITERVTKLLRKTKLQVRVVVEVIHCKNPKHLITEVIDLVSPTLVILGSRGRSALKGVILGSFSNYLVTKSSVPVMVARKRLRKQSKYKQGRVRQINNLSNPAAKSLANAKID